MNIKTFGPKDLLPQKLLYPRQTHSANIVEMVTGEENLDDTDGIWTKLRLETETNPFILGVNTADCAPIAFWNEAQYGVIHAGWRGLCNGIIEKMVEIFGPKNPHVFVGPLLPHFEIQKDFCYEMLEAQFGTTFFEEKEGQTIFHFQKALASRLPEHTQWDGRNTLQSPELGSWRRDKFLEGNRNVTALWP